ncbi:ATP-binding cassette domain-containing protein [Psychromarinibacter sp. C21-152]|uniref:ATP-binding cassette domain-containing protein n=1 Tax=Psychromarinibacter sediminicola TaxID=3033385 RepID=A0AAE3NU15_9RHOB|nr:ATP-binding cassette domain-containing protein [Psychromarinibacter sediminicola]MDF0600557.1 ATP-binding cassette domain-containing protein [Psychromarinibacter sediminicola]
MTPPPGLAFSGRVTAGGSVLLGPVEMQAAAGRWTCLLGPSGTGKSTLLHCFAGLAEALTLDGRAEAQDDRPLQGRVALMAQSDGLLPWLTVQENVTLGARLRRRRPDRTRAQALLARVGLADLARRKPHALSGGQRQRAALARTLYEDRPVALLDEPFSALDVATRAQMQDLAASELRGRTVLHVTHDPAEAARLGERILVLTAAGIEEIGTDGAPPIPRAPDAGATLATTGRLTRRLLEAA